MRRLLPLLSGILAIIVLLVVAGFLLPAWWVKGAAVAFDPAARTVKTGQRWTVMVNIAAQRPVNAEDVVVSYPKDLVKVIGTSIAGSVFTIPVFQPQVNAQAGTVEFVQATPQPFQGNAGRIGAVTFEATRNGSVALSVSKAKIVAHDAQGTDVYRDKLNPSIGMWVLGGGQ